MRRVSRAPALAPAIGNDRVGPEAEGLLADVERVKRKLTSGWASATAALWIAIPCSCFDGYARSPLHL